MKILVTGADGQLGKALVKLNGIRGICLRGLTKHECDVLNEEQVHQHITSFCPDAVIHCAAYTAVDRAEIEPDLCRAINIDGVRNVAQACLEVRAALMLLSTDYVFSGEGDTPYDVDDERKSLNQYGQSKIEAENCVMELEKYYIVRTSWMFGDGDNFVKTISRLAARRDKISVVCDQIGSPTFSDDLAPLLIQMLERAPCGIYHATNEGFCSWADLAMMSLQLQGLQTRILPVTSEEYCSCAQRPKNSRLSKNCLDQVGLKRLARWEDALERYIEKYGGRNRE